jgi:hypothetical protein
MMTIAGSAQRSFTFPAGLPTAFAYYSDIERILPYLPHIYLTRSYDSHHFRACYTSTELGIYHIHIYCDLEARFDKETRAIRMKPFEGAAPVKANAGMSTASGQGFFSSQSLFYPAGNQTRVDYSLHLQAQLPTPLGLRLMPGRVVDTIAARITRIRIHEIAQGFIERSIRAFPDWLAEIGDAKRL